MSGIDTAPGPHCLVTGAMGRIGDRLVPELLAAGHRVRVLAHSPEKLRDRPWAGRAEVAKGDVADEESVRAAMRGIDVAYYLVHTPGTGPSAAETGRTAARIFGEQAHLGGVRRMVCLGGLVPMGVPEARLPHHLRSQAEAGRILGDCGVPTTVLRTAMVIGAGSVSFEVLRHLTERLPVVVAPRWMRTRVQPIAVEDVLRYLMGSAYMPIDVSRSFDIGGPDITTYTEMMRRYAAVNGLPPRVIVSMPVLAPWLSGQWIGLVTPVPPAVAKPLAESLRHEAVCREHDIARYVPDPPGRPADLDTALALALQEVKHTAGSADNPGKPWFCPPFRGNRGANVPPVREER